MNLLETIKADSITARKERQPYASFLVTLYSEAAMVGKNANRESLDEEVLKVVEKFAKNAQEIITQYNKSLSVGADPHNISGIHGYINQATLEQNLCKQYLPQQLSETELSQALDVIMMAFTSVSMKDMGSIMGELKREYPNCFDGSVASKLIKEKISER